MSQSSYCEVNRYIFYRTLRDLVSDYFLYQNCHFPPCLSSRVVAEPFLFWVGVRHTIKICAYFSY